MWLPRAVRPAAVSAIPSQVLLRRPTAKTAVPGLLLCGANTVSGHGIAGAMSSGLMAAAVLVGSQLLRETLGGTGVDDGPGAVVL